MAANTKIEWATHTFNPWRGCEHATDQSGQVHPACVNCYAEAMSQRNPKTLGAWGSQASGGARVCAAESYWRQPLKWNAAAEAGERQRVFCASLADVFEDWRGPIHSHRGERLSHVVGACEVVETMDSMRRELFALIDATPWLDWLLLTKRPENVRRMWPQCYLHDPGPHGGNFIGQALPEFKQNVWLGTSISDQHTADIWVPRLLECRDLCPVLFLSIEPLLGPVDLGAWLACGDGTGVSWVIVGGESGPQARPLHPDWARNIRDQCQAAGVPFFFKQWGEWAPADNHPLKNVGDKQAIQCVRFAGGDRVFCGDGRFSGEAPQEGDAWMARVGKKAAGRLLDGREWNELPEVAYA